LRILLESWISSKHILGKEGKMGQWAEEVIKIAKMEEKSLNRPDEVRTSDKGKLELIHVGGRTGGRTTFQPGWR
jgi:hypothetical protein